MTVDVLNREVKHDTRREAYHTNNPNKTNISSEGTSSCSTDYKLYMLYMSRRGKLTRESLFVTIICFNASQRVILQVIVFVVFEQFFRIPSPNFKVFQKIKNAPIDIASPKNE